MLHLANFGKTDPIMTNTQLLNIKVDKYNKNTSVNVYYCMIQIHMKRMNNTNGIIA